MPNTYSVVHFLNQFFAGFGGENQASMEPTSIPRAIGPGKLLQNEFGNKIQITSTVVCGDDLFADDPNLAVRKLIELIRPAQPNLFVSGPAFNSGRYGEACGRIAREVSRKFNIPAVSGMAKENPGLAYRKDVYIIPTSDNIRGMKTAIHNISHLGFKLLHVPNNDQRKPVEYYSRGFRKNIRSDLNGAQRALNLLLAKIQGDPFNTELELPKFDRVAPAPPVKNLKKSKIAVITTGGLVPKGNPDNLPSTKAITYGQYPLVAIERLDSENYEVQHGGYSTNDVTQDPNRLVPLDVLRSLENEGRIAKIHEYLYTFSGCSTYYEFATAIGSKIAKDLRNHEIDAAIITSA